MQETWVQSLHWADPLEEGDGYPLQYSGLENSMDCIVHVVTESRTQLSGLHFHHIYIDRESEIFIMSDWLRSPRNFHLKVKWPWKLTVKFQTKSKGLWPKGASGMSPTQIWRPEKRKCWYPRGITFKEKVDVVTGGHFCSSFNSVLFCAHTGNNDLLYSLYWFKGKSISNTIIYTTSSNVLPATRTFCGLVKWTFKLIITEEEEADGILFYWGYTKSTEWFEED